jgi:hypothetical protein
MLFVHAVELKRRKKPIKIYLNSINSIFILAYARENEKILTKKKNYFLACIRGKDAVDVVMALTLFERRFGQTASFLRCC